MLLAASSRRATDVLLKEFGIEPAANYRYDDDKRTIIKLDAAGKERRARYGRPEPSSTKSASGSTSEPNAKANPTA